MAEQKPVNFNLMDIRGAKPPTPNAIVLPTAPFRGDIIALWEEPGKKVGQAPKSVFTLRVCEGPFLGATTRIYMPQYPQATDLSGFIPGHWRALMANIVPADRLNSQESWNITTAKLVTQPPKKVCFFHTAPVAGDEVVAEEVATDDIDAGVKKKKKSVYGDNIFITPEEYAAQLLLSQAASEAQAPAPAATPRATQPAATERPAAAAQPPAAQPPAPKPNGAPVFKAPVIPAAAPAEVAAPAGDDF